MRLLKDKKGLTMVEVLVAFSILLILMGITSVILISSMNNYSRAAKLSSAQQLGTDAYNFISNRLTYAVAAEIGGNSNDLQQELKIEDGRLYFRYTDDEFSDVIGSEEMYYGFSLAMTISATDDLIDLTVRVLNNEGTSVFEKSSSFKMINLAVAEGAYLIGSTTATTNPLISLTQIGASE